MTVRTRFTAALLAALPLIAPALAAQQVPADSLRMGEHVRITASEPRLRGTVSRLRDIGATTVRVTALKAERDSYQGTIALANVGSMEVLRHKRGAGRTA